MGIFSSKSRDRSKTTSPPPTPQPPPSPPPPTTPEIIVVEPSSDAHAIIYKTEVDARKKEMRAMTEAKPVCSVFEENPFKTGICRACKHPKSAHTDPYADILDDLADEDEAVVDE